MIYVVLYLVGAILFVDGLTMAQFIKVFSPVAGEANIALLGLGFSAKGLADLSFAIGGLIAIMALVILSKDLLAGFGETVSATAAATSFTFVVAYFMFAGAITHIWNPDLFKSAAAAVSNGAKSESHGVLCWLPATRLVLPGDVADADLYRARVLPYSRQEVAQSSTVRRVVVPVGVLPSSCSSMCSGSDTMGAG